MAMGSPFHRGDRSSAGEPLDGIDLDDDLALEVLAYREPEIRVRRPCKAVRARVAASPVRVDRVAERHPRGRPAPC